MRPERMKENDSESIANISNWISTERAESQTLPHVDLQNIDIKTTEHVNSSQESDLELNCSIVNTITEVSRKRKMNNSYTLRIKCSWKEPSKDEACSVKLEREIFVIVTDVPVDWDDNQLISHVQNDNLIFHLLMKAEILTNVEQNDVINEVEIYNGDPTSPALAIAFKDLQNISDELPEIPVKKYEKKELDDPQNEITDVRESTKNRLFWDPRQDVWEEDPNGLYGLKPEYLKSLHIYPPIGRWVHVSNFRCDKSELRDVMELAGHVVICSVVSIKDKYAKVMYSHPLEAVQAVSMLSGQILYGQPLTVVMSVYTSDTTILPKGLINVGPGLGSKGQPLREIVKHFERYVKNQSSSVDTKIFDLKEHAGTFNSIDDEMKRNVDNFKQETEDDKFERSSPNFIKVQRIDSPNENKSDDSSCSSTNGASNNGQRLNNFRQVRPTFGPVGLKPTAPLPVPIQRPNVSGPMLQQFPQRPIVPSTMGMFGFSGAHSLRTCGPIVQMVPRPVPPTMANPSMPIMPNAMPRTGTMIGPRFPGSNSVTVRMSNLPLTTTFPFLCEKLTQCGQVVSLQFTTPGCAVVQFGHRAYAEKCFQIYNGMNVDGYTIAVKFI